MILIFYYIPNDKDSNKQILEIKNDSLLCNVTYRNFNKTSTKIVANYDNITKAPTLVLFDENLKEVCRWDNFVTTSQINKVIFEYESKCMV